MPTEPEPITLAQVAHRAAQVCALDEADADIGDFLARFEDADEPVTAIPDIEERVAETVGTIDPEGELPQLVMASAVVVYLAHRREAMEEDREEILRLAARAEFDGSPPPAAAEWLAREGVEL